MYRKVLVIISILILAVIILTACSNATFKVTFDVDGQVYTTQEVKKGGNATLPSVPVKTGYIFDNWYLDKDVWTQPFKADTAVISDITVYAHWIRTVEPIQNTYTITFDSRGGSTVNPLRIKEGQSFTLPDAPTLQDYNFEGWFLDTSFTTPFTTDYKVVKNITVYAKWVEADSTSYFVRKGSVITEITKAGKSAGTIVLPEEIDGVKITALGDSLFAGNTNLKKISFPAGSSYTTIGKEAFKGCTALSEIKFINNISTIGEGAFMGCKSLVSVNLPTELTTISKNLFNGCTSLKYANLQYVKVDAIGDGAYSGCSSLLGPIKIYSDIKSIGAEAFKGCSQVSSFDIEDGVERIGDKAFYNCIKLTSAKVPDTVTSLGSYVFYNCSSITSAYLGKGISSIPDFTFYKALKLETLTLAENNNITSIGASAFAYCEELGSIAIPSAVTAIGNNAFNGCRDITSIVIPSGITKLEAQTFMNAVSLVTVTLEGDITSLGTAVFMNCGELTTLSGLNSASNSGFGKVTEIGSAVFSACKKLKNVVIPSGLTVIKDSAFENCVSLDTIVISDGVTTIVDKAFRGCIALEQVTLPLTLLSIGDYGFADCVKLNNVELNPALENLSASAFDNCTALTSLTVNVANTHFEGEGGVLYSKGKDTLLFYSDALSDTTFIVPNGVKKIAHSTFRDNEILTSVTLPEGLEEIEAYAFRGCLNLANINYPSSLKEIGEYAFSGTKLTSAVLPMGLLTIDQNAFNNTLVRTATLPITLISVGKEIFYGAPSNLAITVEGDSNHLSGWSGNWNLSREVSGYTITYGGGRVTSDNGEYQYIVRDGLAVLTEYRGDATTVNVPATIDGFQVYGLYKTFIGNTTITNVIVPNSIQVISEMTFKGMTALTDITLPFVGAYRGAQGPGALFGYVFDYSENSNEGWTEQHAEGGSKSKYYTHIPSSVSSVTLTDCEVIPYGAFSNIHNLTAITLPQNLKTIKGMAFYHTSLERVTLPLSLTTIEKDAFTYNYNRYQNVTSGAPSPAVIFDIEATSRPEGWVEGCFDKGSVLNFA